MSREPEIEEAVVYIVVGRGVRGDDSAGREIGADDQEATPINVLLTAVDEEECIERALTALAGKGFTRVELDRIGVVDGEPEDPTFASAYWNAIDGQVAVIAFHG
ncbi:regulator [Microbaculum marinum]|uniref:Regulator n=1 Tax=Microbaculum marinum TaxID=1764581 RepID=A0AAW9S5M6_9HYPH